MDNIERRILREKLKNNPVERDKFIANPGQYLKDIGVSVPEQPLLKAFEPAETGPLPVAFCVGYPS